MTRTMLQTAWPSFIARLANRTALPAPGESLDYVTSGDAGQAPARPAPLFGWGERVIGRPAQLFRAFPRRPRPPARRRPGDAKRAGKAWLGMLRELAPFGAKGRIAGINAYVNSAAAVGEIAEQARQRRWTVPLSLFTCTDGSHDYALAKYVSLRRLGFHPDRLHLVWLEDGADGGGGGEHAVLTVTLGGHTLVLDNRSTHIASVDDGSRLRPICSLNGRRFSVHWDPNRPGGVKAALSFLEQRLRGAMQPAQA